MPLPLSKSSSDIPDWLLKSVVPNMKSKEEVDSAVKVSDSGDLTMVKSKIEESAKTGKDICINGNLTSDQKKELEEYAQVCNVDTKKIVQVSDKDIVSKKAEAKPTTPEKDPFGVIDAFADPKSFEKNKDWDRIKKSQKVTTQGKSEGNVTRIDGVEKYEEQRVVGVRPGENSIAAPDNIGISARSKEKGNSEIIRDANQKRKEKIAFNPKEWEGNVKKDYSGVISNSGVKLTEASPQQSHSKVANGQHSMFDEKDPVSSVPEKTAGESLKEKNEQRKASIQRPKTEDKSWDKVQSSKKPVVSDLLFDELKKRLSVKSDNPEKK